MHVFNFLICVKNLKQYNKYISSYTEEVTFRENSVNKKNKIMIFKKSHIITKYNFLIGYPVVIQSGKLYDCRSICNQFK